MFNLFALIQPPGKEEATVKEISQTSDSSALGRSHMYWDCWYLPLFIWMDRQGVSEVHLGDHPAFEEKESNKPSALLNNVPS